jgi:hypothetical protein
MGVSIFFNLSGFVLALPFFVGSTAWRADGTLGAFTTDVRKFVEIQRSNILDVSLLREREPVPAAATLSVTCNQPEPRLSR